MDIPDEAVEILKVLSRVSSSQWITAAEFAQHFNLEEQKIEHFLDILRDNDLIHPHYNMMYPTSYSLNSNGRKYLVEHDLL